MSEFHAKPLTDELPTTPSPRTSPNSKGIKQVALAPCFPPLYPTPYYPSIICHSPIKAPFCSSHNFFGFVLFNIVSACVFIPIIAVHATVYLLPVNDDLYNNLIPGFNLTKMQLIGIIVFVSVDLILYCIVYFTANYSTIFYGCSTEMSYKVFTGTQFIPIILIIKLLQPLTLLSEQDMNGIIVDEPFIWAMRLLLCIFIFVSIMPLLFSEVKLFRSIITDFNTLPQSQPLIMNKRKTSAYFFFAFKVTLLFCFVLEMAVINFGIISPMSIDYPLIFSAANLIFIFYSHRPVIVKYHIIETGRTAITSEFGCLDGRRCCNKYRPNNLLSFERTEISFTQAASCEYTFYFVKELPKWLQYKITKIQKKCFNPKIGKF